MHGAIAGLSGKEFAAGSEDVPSPCTYVQRGVSYHDCFLWPWFTKQTWDDDDMDWLTRAGGTRTTVPRMTVAVSGCLGWLLSKEMGFSVLFLGSLRGAGRGMLSTFNRLYHPRPSRILFGLIHPSLLFALAGLSCSSAICSHPHSPQAVTLYRSHRKPQLPHVDGLNPGISEPPSAAASEAATQTRTRGHSSEPPRVR